MKVAFPPFCTSAQRAVDYVWPGKRWRQSLAAFVPGDYLHDYDE
ncbi:MAG TPA: hypothetical protein VMQ73_11730 [Methylomirabilota bacterium]|nr:hypothetical protein [Methylomirabilota bacterium]